MLIQFYNIMLQTPWWVYILLIYLIRVGVQASKTNIVSIKKLFVFPAILTMVSMHTLMTSFGIQADVITVWLGSMLVGVGVGYLLVRNQSIRVDKVHRLLQLPGTWITLSLVLIVFASKYYFVYEISVYPQLINQNVFEFGMLFTSGFFTGLFIGRLGFYVHQFRKRKSIDLTLEDFNAEVR